MGCNMRLRTPLPGRLIRVLTAPKGTRAMEIQKNIAGDSYELLVSGRVDGEGASRLDEGILAILFNKNKDTGQEPKTIYVNLNSATFLRSAGVRALMQHSRTMKSRRGQLLVTCPSPEAADVLKMAGLYEQLVEKI
jgi:anti-anti-sigma factor